MATKDITVIVNGSIFKCPTDWTVAEAEERIRSRYALHGGGIEKDGIAVRATDLISSFAGTLTFAGGQPADEGKSSLNKQLSELAESVQGLRIQIHSIKGSVEIVNFALTPSEACKSTALTSMYQPLMHSLKLDPMKNPLSLAQLEECSEKQPAASAEKKLTTFRFRWSNDGVERSETDSYAPAAQHLRELFPDHRVMIIGNGQNLSDGLLFSVPVYSLKPRDAPSSELRKEHQLPRKCFAVRGRCDVVVLKKGESLPIPANVLLGVEIKPQSVMQPAKKVSEDAETGQTAGREAVVQLLGLNVGNMYSSPPVVLSNLMGLHYVLYIDCVDVVKFRYVVKQFRSFTDACFFAATIGKRPCVTRYFASPPSPKNSPEGSATASPLTKTEAATKDGYTEDADDSSDVNGLVDEEQGDDGKYPNVEIVEVEEDAK
jgi:hypothetical protein